jgi:RHH-type proline utilization regulon transcriptional repressor/proline dehydrogenase/delta 1-pyrroline-5-carboxylate dehydrogenase
MNAFIFCERSASVGCGPQRRAIAECYRKDETAVIEQLLAMTHFSDDTIARITRRARQLVQETRAHHARRGGLDAFLNEYGLSNQEGVVLMCLAESLLRIPDAKTRDRLIRDKLGSADWERHLGHSGSLLVNASTWALMLTGRLVNLHHDRGRAIGATVAHLVANAGEPMIRQAVVQAMQILSRQFVMGRTIQEAQARAKGQALRRYRFSYDMLGEAARTAQDVARYFAAYEGAITALARGGWPQAGGQAPEVSVKLSALHPRFEYAQRARVLRELVPRLYTLLARTRKAGIGLIIDAEESHRLDLTLDVMEALAGRQVLGHWDGFGVAVQAYQKRALPVIDWLAELATLHRCRLRIRLVKGAYWDTEIKHAQQGALNGYPVFTRKVATDVSYLACARRILEHGDRFYPQFATHNAYTLAALLEMLGERRDLEFQRLHGMGEALYEQMKAESELGIGCRIYAPVGSHEDLLPYLVRRLLENGANTSFVNRLVDAQAPVEALTTDPVAELRGLREKPHPRIPLPRNIYRPERTAAAGSDLTDPLALQALAKEMGALQGSLWRAMPIVGGQQRAGVERMLRDPSDRERVIGRVIEAEPMLVARAVERAHAAVQGWDAIGAARRAGCLERVAALLEQHRPELMVLAIREAGKTLPDAVSEVREAVDFCRYYAVQCGQHFGQPKTLPGPTGEQNQITLHGRGVFACISPWNFPLAIFTGQVAAALAAGNTVVAKPAEQTPLMAARAVQLFHEAGVPPDVLHLVPGPGPSVGAALVAQPAIRGVAFTGSTDTAGAIHRALAEQVGPIVPLIAETGGQNAMIVDSSALPEQVVQDVMGSSFLSAGQRCSALRVLFIQADIADKVVDMLAGAMAELKIGDPGLLETDVGPVIDSEARSMLEHHAERMVREGKLVYRCRLAQDCARGTYFPPCAFEIDKLDRLQREIFGPILHIVRYQGRYLDDVIDAINRTGYGLTVGIHSRVDETIAYIHQRVRVGNTYVNRNIVGSIVGTQPFGGEGLSGTGPKAGGPYYLPHFATERTLTINTTAQGGNAALLTLNDH